MNVRGHILELGDAKTVNTSYGESDLVEVTVRPEDRDPVRVTLWGKWTETAEYAEPGMELLVTDPEEKEFRGEQTYSTSGDSYVVLEPDFLVDVTDVRSWVQCPRMYYLNKLSGIPLNYPVVKGTIVHEVFGWDGTRPKSQTRFGVTPPPSRGGWHRARSRPRTSGGRSTRSSRRRSG